MGLRFLLIVLICVGCAEVQRDSSPQRAIIRTNDTATPDATSDKSNGKTSSGKKDGEKNDGEKNEQDSGDVGDTPPKPVVDEPQAPTADTLIVNELQAADPDWVELSNRSLHAIDLSGVALADADNEGNSKHSEAVYFAEGTLLGPGAFIVVVGGQTESLGELSTTCADVATECYWALFKLSQKSGDKLFVLSKDDEVLNVVDYPAEGANKGETWSRQDDDSWASCAPSPGAANGCP